MMMKQPVGISLQYLFSRETKNRQGGGVGKGTDAFQVDTEDAVAGGVEQQFVTAGEARDFGLRLMARMPGSSTGLLLRRTRRCGPMRSFKGWPR